MGTAVEPEIKSLGEQRTALQKDIDAQVLERVKRGMALLEEQYGPDWVDNIDLARLDLKQGENCVLGQVYDDVSDGDGYGYGLEALNIECEDEDYGFSVPEGESRQFGDREAWERLQDAWEFALTPRVFKNG